MITKEQNYECNDMPQITSIDDSNVATLTKKEGWHEIKTPSVKCESYSQR